MKPPSLPDACAGVTVVHDNPPSCPATGNVVTYVVTRISADPDPASGFDLDGAEGSTCREGSLARPDAAGGIDNSLATVDLYHLNRQFFERACRGAVTTSFQVDANTEQACALVTVADSGAVVSSAALHLTDGCLHGVLDRFVVPVGDASAPVENARLTATLGATGFSNMILGATATSFSSDVIFDNLQDASNYSKYWDIRTDLDGTGSLECDAISLTLELGGIAQ